MKLVLTHAANIPSNKYQHLLLFMSLENAPSTSLKLCANSSNKFQHLWLYFSLRNVPRICLELCALFSNKYQHSLLYLSLENVLKVCLGNNALLKCLSQQYGPALMVACCLGFRALDSSRNRALHQSLKLISVFIFHFSLFSPSCSLELEPSQTPPGNSCLSPKNLFLDNHAQMKS